MITTFFKNLFATIMCIIICPVVFVISLVSSLLGGAELLGNIYDLLTGQEGGKK